MNRPPKCGRRGIPYRAEATSRERQKREFGELIKDWPNSEVQPTLARISRKRNPQDGPSAGLSKPSNARAARAEAAWIDCARSSLPVPFAALDVLEGSVIGQGMQRHRPQEFLRFLNAIERQVPAGKVIHV